MLNGEEQPGGLVIVRAPVSCPTSAQGNNSIVPTLTHPPSRPSSSHSHRLPSSAAGALNPPSKKFKADANSLGPLAHRPVAKSKNRDVLTSSREEPEVDEDVRQMETEADHLRRRSRANDTTSPSSLLHTDFKFPASPKPKPPRQQQPSDALHPLPAVETPQIAKNKLMREGHHRRKSSLNSRGKRISNSFESTGVICRFCYYLSLKSD